MDILKNSKKESLLPQEIGVDVTKTSDAPGAGVPLLDGRGRPCFRSLGARGFRITIVEIMKTSSEGWCYKFF